MAEISHRAGHTIVFARTQRGASRMAEQLREAGVMAGALHGGLTQGARARVLAAFKEGSLPVLVATDVAARGIDVDDVTLVLQVDPPMNSKDYLHRAGRTARAGQDGAVISLILPHQRRTMARIYRSAGVHPEEAQVRLGDEHVAQVAHCTPALDAPIAQEEYDAIVAALTECSGVRSRAARAGEGAAPFFLHFDHAEIEEGPMGHMVEDRHLRAALDAALDEAPGATVRRGAEWLLRIQNEDGGWGEDAVSYRLDYKGYEVAPSTSSQTAWALLALMAAGEVENPAVVRGVEYLKATQTEKGLWDEQRYTATGFPRVFYLRYHGYSKFFPLWALARYRNLRSTNSRVVGVGM